MLYREALTQAWQRFGYPEVLADCRTRLLCTDEESEMEYLAEEVTELSGSISSGREKPINFSEISAENRDRQKKHLKTTSKPWRICSIHISKQSFPEFFWKIFIREAEERHFLQRKQMSRNF